MAIHDIITQRAATEISDRMGCVVKEIEWTDQPEGFNVICEFNSDKMKSNYLTLIHAIQFNNRLVHGFVAVDDLDCLINKRMC